MAARARLLPALDRVRRLRSRTPSPALLQSTTQDSAELAVFLAGPGSRNITGQAHYVDGGLVMH